MTQAVQIFSNPEYGDVRIVDSNGEPLFVGRDVATALGYSNPNDALAKHVPDKYKRVSRIATPGGEQNMTLINEAGFYKLVMRSKLPNAEKFSDWVCEEVLPSIRKTGLYINPNAPINPDLLIKLGNDMKQLQIERDAALAKVDEYRPKADFFDRFLNSDETMPITYIAKMYGVGGATMNTWLANLKIQYKVGRRWVLFHEYADKGYTRAIPLQLTSGRTVTQTEWTNRGRLFIYNRLKEIGTVPEREREERQLELFEEARQ